MAFQVSVARLLFCFISQQFQGYKGGRQWRMGRDTGTGALSAEEKEIDGRSQARAQESRSTCRWA